MNMNPFKKKEKEPDLSDLDLDSDKTTTPNFDSPFKQNENEDSFGNPINKNRYEAQDISSPFPATGTNIQQPQQQNQDNKDIQLILSKLDTIKSEITNINHRLDNIEKQRQPQQPQKYRW